jgi:hypothetical protein
MRTGAPICTNRSTRFLDRSPKSRRGTTPHVSINLIDILVSGLAPQKVASGMSDQKPASALRIRTTANMRPSTTPTICAVLLSLIKAEIILTAR